MKTGTALFAVAVCLLSLAVLWLRGQGPSGATSHVTRNQARDQADPVEREELRGVEFSADRRSDETLELDPSEAHASPESESESRSRSGSESGDTPADEAREATPIPEQPLPPGVIVVRLEGADPAGVTATIVQGYRRFMGFREGDADKREASLTATSSTAGEARFSGLSPMPWSVGISSSTGGENWSFVTLKKEQPGARVVFKVGTSGVRGTVWDEEGQPIQGAVIQVNSKSNSAHPINRHTTTAHDGTYELQGVAPGYGIVSAARRWHDDSLTREESAAAATAAELGQSQVSFPEGEMLEVDFGSAGGLHKCTVRVLNCLGDPLHNGTAQLVRERPFDTFGQTIDSDGIAAVKAPVGTWTINVRTTHQHYLGVGTVEVIANEHTETTVHLPKGTVVEGHLILEDWSTVKAVAANQSVSLYSEIKLAPKYSANVASDGSYKFHSVATGTYFVRTWPRNERATETIEIPKGSPRRLVHDVMVTATQ